MMRLMLSFHQAFFVVDHAFAGVFGNVKLLGVHADGVLWTDFHTKAAIHTFTKIQDKLGGVFFDVRVWMFRGSDLNAPGRAYGLAHHAGNTSGGTIFALG